MKSFCAIASTPTSLILPCAYLLWSFAADSFPHSCPPLLTPPAPGKVSADSTQRGAMDTTRSTVGWAVDTTQTHFQLAQDALQLVESVLPVVPLRSGDTGLPSLLGSSGLPPRLIDVHVDGVRWMPGVYGAVDAALLPEALAEQIALRSHEADLDASMPKNALGVSFAPAKQEAKTPLSSVQYAHGPFGGDVLRAWVARRLSSRMGLHFSLDRANSSGQFDGLSFNGQKLSARLRYAVSQSASVSYQYLDSKNSAGARRPFYPEEFAADTSGVAKQRWIFHGVSFQTSRFFARAFHWQGQYDYRAPGLRLRNHDEVAGLESSWQMTRGPWRLLLNTEILDDRLSSRSIDVPRSQTYIARLATSRKTGKHGQVGVAAALHNEAHWPTAFDADADFVVPVRQSLFAEVGVSRRVINPAPGEYADSSVFLRATSRLEPAELLRATSGLRWQRREGQTIEGRLAINRFARPFAVDASGGVRLHNAPTKQVPSLDVLLLWRLSRRFAVQGNGSWMLVEAPELFWYQYVRRGYLRGVLEFHREFFDGDLDTRWRVAARHYGESLSPVYDSSGHPALVRVDAGTLLDAQLLIRHGDALIYFTFENILDRKLEWRAGIPAPAAFLKWGVRWDLQN